MSEFSHYEGDQSALYSGGHHQDRNSAESKAQVKRIWKITAWLSIITIAEVALGLWCYNDGPVGKSVANIMFVIGTMLKAGLIVSVFMHLGDEVKNMIMTIVIPLFLFVWFIIAFMMDGAFWLHMNQLMFNGK
jgi:cytochrome c oxidase subunit IV